MLADKTAKRTGFTALTASSDHVLLSAALPYKIEDGQVYVLLVTSRENGRWITPRGGRKKNETLGEAAKREALEEAGIRGKIISKEGKDGVIGSYHSFKTLDDHKVVPSEIHVFLLRKTSEAENYPEKGERVLQWATIDRAIELIQDDALETGLVALLKSLQQNPPAEFLKRPHRPKHRPKVAHGKHRKIA
jgi:8-oxo-dGTP pyrophosphatase MutT (NUDIX family)